MVRRLGQPARRHRRHRRPGRALGRAVPPTHRWRLAVPPARRGDRRPRVERGQPEGLGIYESDRPAIARYTAAEFGQFRAHIDAGASHSTRKLSYVVQLDKGSSYTGGDLFFSDLGTAAPRDQGTLVVFPSTLTHVVTPVIEGIRHVVVGWVDGPAGT